MTFACIALGTTAGFSRVEARASSDVVLAAIALGRLQVVGVTDKPNTPVTLDGRFQTTSDKNGTFSFEETYHPATCIVGVDIEATIHRAVVSNCSQQTSFGPLPFVGAALPRFTAPSLKTPRTTQAFRTPPVRANASVDAGRRAKRTPAGAHPDRIERDLDD